MTQNQPNKPNKPRKQQGDKLTEQARHATEVAREQVGQAGEEVSEQTEQWAQRAREKAEQAREEAEPYLERARPYMEQAQEMYEQTREQVEHVAGQAGERARELAHKAGLRDEQIPIAGAVLGGILTLGAGIAVTLLLSREKESRGQRWSRQAREEWDELSEAVRQGDWPRARRELAHLRDEAADAGHDAYDWMDERARHMHDEAEPYLRRARRTGHDAYEWASDAASTAGGWLNRGLKSAAVRKLADYAARGASSAGKFAARHPIWSAKAGKAAYKTRRYGKEGWSRARDAATVLRSGRSAIQPGYGTFAGNVLLGAAIVGVGVAAAYYFQPERGAGRRRLAAQRLSGTGRRVYQTASGAAQDVAQRAQGAAHEGYKYARDAASRAGIGESEQLTDDQLVGRVRSQLGHAVEGDLSRLVVEAHNGRITLRGDVPQHQRQRLVTAARGVRGVKGVEDQLQGT